MAKSNGEMVEVAVRMTRDVGRTPATVEEARKILSLYDTAAGREAAAAVGHTAE
ncbi:MAG: 3-keto-5-aminohexanoate cleavage protein [Sandaracinaceae bacterium]